ncbi:hypothetical protein GCM10011490_24400 [Pseudoclavibacter endophyticus]|nr:hypothetical protein GCM10011490_24400 [Pseudoclavibacter endophyticus]
MAGNQFVYFHCPRAILGLGPVRGSNDPPGTAPRFGAAPDESGETRPVLGGRAQQSAEGSEVIGSDGSVKRGGLGSHVDPARHVDPQGAPTWLLQEDGRDLTANRD